MRKQDTVISKDPTEGVWLPFKMWYGWTLNLAKGLKCTVSKSTKKEEGFKITVFGLHGKRFFKDSEEAKRVAEHTAWIFLAKAIDNLNGILGETDA